MRTSRAEQSYRKRVARVVAFIVAHPMEAHRFEDLARLAHFSPFHFHRVYSSITGETVAATVRRVRLALATRLLGEGRHSVTAVARAVGYDSPQAFTRAFGQFTGQSPRTFQQQLHQAILDPAAWPAGHAAGESPAVRIVERPTQQVLALRHHGPFSTISHTQRRLHAHASTRAAIERLGASFGDPCDMATFRYYAAAVLPESAPPGDADFEMLEIPAGRYAQHRLVGPYARINAAVAALYMRWLPGSGYEPDDRPTLEHYLNSPGTAAPAELQTDLLIPVRSANAP